MAKLSKIIANNKKRALAEKYFKRREELRNAVKNINLSDEEREVAAAKLRKLPKKTSHVRVRNRCTMTGRPRGYLRDFKLSRIAFRELALRGMIPGVTKASW